MNDRRTFLKTLAAATAGMMVTDRGAHGTILANRDKFGELLPLRTLGKTGEKVTMLGLGGAHVGRADEKTAQELIEKAMEEGIRFFDNAESYNNGLSETRYGKYLVPKYREAAFIMTKSTGSDARTAQRHLEESLKRMNTDYVDLWQVHSLRSPEDVDNRIQEGVIEVAMKAKESGKARYIGFTGHSDFKAHQHMLSRTDIFETAQMPINCHDPNYKSFIINVLPTLVERNMGVLAMKTLSNGGFFGGNTHFNGGSNPKIIPNVTSVKEALYFVWSLPVSVLITGPNDVDMLVEKTGLARSFSAMTEEERSDLVQRVGKAGLDGSTVEYYKV